VRAAFAGVPRVKPQWRDRFMKVLIVGESGLGAPDRAACRLPRVRLQQVSWVCVALQLAHLSRKQMTRPHLLRQGNAQSVD
jgi:hypothetical protein